MITPAHPRKRDRRLIEEIHQSKAIKSVLVFLKDSPMAAVAEKHF